MKIPTNDILKGLGQHVALDGAKQAGSSLLPDGGVEGLLQGLNLGGAEGADDGAQDAGDGGPMTTAKDVIGSIMSKFSPLGGHKTDAPPTQGKDNAAAPAPAPAGPPPGVPTNGSGVPGSPNTVPKKDDKPTDPNKHVQDYLDANNGLLGKMGNQEGMKDKLKERYGDWDDPKRSQADRDQSAYNAARHVGTIKNKKNSDGGDRPKDVVTNGKMEGCTKDGDIRDGTEMGDLKNSLKTDGDGQDKNTERVLGNPNLKPTDDDHVTKNGTNEDNAPVIGKRILKGLAKIPEGIKWLADHTLGKIPGIGKVVTGFTDLTMGGLSDGLNAAGDAAGGDKEKAKDDVKQMGHNALATISGWADQASGLLKSTIGKIPGIGKFLAAGGEILDNAIVGTTNVLDTGLRGGNMNDAGINMGKNLLGATVDAGIGIVDPTGVGASMAGKGVDALVGAQDQVVQQGKI